MVAPFAISVGNSRKEAVKMTETNLIKEIQHSSLSWDTVANSNFKALANAIVEGGVELTHLTNPVTYLNGTTGNGSEAWIWKNGDAKLAVVFMAYFKLGNNANGQIIGRLPDVLQPYSDFQVPANQDGVITNGYNSAGPTTDLYYFNWSSASGDTSLGDRRATLIYMAK